jgi:multicomponent Na+:H+ antiporter subunit G
MMQDAVTVFFIAVGTFFLTVGTVGLIRLPNVYNRMHATTKATTLGSASTFLAIFTYYINGAGLTALVGILFLFMTAPIGAHLIARSSQKMGVEFEDDVSWPENKEDVKKQKPRGNALKDFL